MATYVLVHGAGHGGWCWQRVARLLRTAGHEVHTPTLTGNAERRHLLTPETGLDTHIHDVASLLEHEDLRDVILVGHSYGGMVITGVADRMIERVAQLVFLDAAIPAHGESLAEVSPQLAHVFATEGETVDGIDLLLFPERETARKIYGIPDEADWAWMLPRLTPHPYKCFTDRLLLSDPDAVARLPRTIINCPSTLALRARNEKLDRYHAAPRVWEIETGHDTMITEPEITADMFLRLAALEA
jgi:pimeloyl-ACP methyl ester carboxylesterase